MTIDISKLTMEERRDILWAILPKWVGPLELPDTGADNKRLAVMPLVSDKWVQPGEKHIADISASVNRAFKPHRLIIQEPTYHLEEWRSIPVPTKWWQRKRPDKVEIVTSERVFLRNHWSLDSFFVGDTPAMLKYGVVNGDVFGTEKCLNLDCPTAQLGHIISVRVWHNGPTAVPFRALLLGVVMRSEEQMPFVPHGGLAAVE